jgi:hypothetical protein
MSAAPPGSEATSSSTQSPAPEPRGSSPEPATAPAATAPAEASSAPAPRERDSQADDHPVIERFFSQPPPAAAHEGFEDVLGDHEGEPEPLPTTKRGMQLTLGIALLGLVLIGGFLVYNKLLMPTPEDFGPSEVALPTPDMLRAAPPVDDPGPQPEHVQNAEPPQVAPGVEPAVEPLPEPASAENQVPAEGAEPPGAPGSEPPAEAVSAPAETAPREPLPGYLSELETARRLGFRRSAEQAFLRALAIDPQGGDALSGLAMLYLNQGKNEKARERAQQAVTADPQNTEGWIVLGASLSVLGDPAEARKAYQECAGLEGKYAVECRRMLR